MEATRPDNLPGAGSTPSLRGKLEIPQYVDFTTGSIDFRGDVVVHRGVRDGLAVKTDGHIDVYGIIEGATIDCGGNLTAHGGMAGQERGAIRVAGIVRAKYLHNFAGQIGGDLLVEREIINSTLAIGGQTRCGAGTIMGGHLTVTGLVEVSVLGSSASTPTHLSLGTVPFFEDKLAQVTHVVAQIRQARTTLAAEQEQLRCQHVRPTAQDRERQTEILFEIQRLDQSLTRALILQETVQKNIDTRCTIQVDVSHRLFPGVLFTIARVSYQITEERRGPLSLAWQPGVGPVCQREGSAPTPLAQIARSLAAPAAKAPTPEPRSVPCAS